MKNFGEVFPHEKKLVFSHENEMKTSRKKFKISQIINFCEEFQRINIDFSSEISSLYKILESANVLKGEFFTKFYKNQMKIALSDAKSLYYRLCESPVLFEEETEFLEKEFFFYEEILKILEEFMRKSSWDSFEFLENTLYV